MKIVGPTTSSAANLVLVETLLPIAEGVVGGDLVRELNQLSPNTNIAPAPRRNLQWGKEADLFSSPSAGATEVAC